MKTAYFLTDETPVGGKIKQGSAGRTDMTRVKMWYDKPMPVGCGVTQAEWEWHCYRTKGRELPPADRVELIRERAKVVQTGKPGIDPIIRKGRHG